MASRTSQDQLNAGDVIAGYEIVEIVPDPQFHPNGMQLFLEPVDPTFAPDREWVLKRDEPADEEGRPLLCPRCYGPDSEGYPIEVLEG
jgi:hypothetical protein